MIRFTHSAATAIKHSNRLTSVVLHCVGDIGLAHVSVCDISWPRYHEEQDDHHIAYLLYFTLLYTNSSAIGVEWIDNRTYVLHPVVDIAISLYHFGPSSSHRFRGLPLGRIPTGWITSALLWGAVGAILMTL